MVHVYSQAAGGAWACTKLPPFEVCVCVCVCVCACVRACACACLRARVCVLVHVGASPSGRAFCMFVLAFVRARVAEHGFPSMHAGRCLARQLVAYRQCPGRVLWRRQSHSLERRPRWPVEADRIHSRSVTSTHAEPRLNLGSALEQAARSLAMASLDLTFLSC